MNFSFLTITMNSFVKNIIKNYNNMMWLQILLLSVEKIIENLIAN